MVQTFSRDVARKSLYRKFPSSVGLIFELWGPTVNVQQTSRFPIDIYYADDLHYLTRALEHTMRDSGVSELFMEARGLEFARKATLRVNPQRK